MATPLTEDDRALLEELGLPVLSPTGGGALGTILDLIRVAGTNSKLKAVFIASKENRERPSVLQGKESTIKFHHLGEVSKATLYSVVKPLRELGHQVIPYAKGYLITLHVED